MNINLNSKLFLLVDHPNGGRDDRVSKAIIANGHRVQWCRPLKGDTLPDLSEIDGCISYGGSGSANDDSAEMSSLLRWTESFAKTDKPYWGICLGAQILAKALGAEVYSCQPETGFVEVRATGNSNHLLNDDVNFYQWHKETFDLPKASELFGTGTDVPNQAFAISDTCLATQFHPEVSWNTCNRWLTSQRYLWNEEQISKLETHLPRFLEYDPMVSQWVDQIVDMLAPKSMQSVRYA